MLQTKKYQLVGAKKFVGDIEGKHFDSCKLFVLAPLDVSTGNAMGAATVEIGFGKSENFAKLGQFKLPCLVEVDYTEVARGGQLQQVVSDVRAAK